MTTQSPPTTGIDTEVKDSWLPMVVIGMGQVQMSLNINALPVSIGNIVNEFDTAPTTVGSAIVAYSLAVAGFVMLGGKLGQKFGSLRIFQIATVLLMIAMIIMTFSSSAEIMIVAQLIAGLAAAAIVPTLVVLIANNYRGKQQSAALGILGAVQAIDREPGFERTMILIDVGLIGVNNYILTRLLQFERSIELNSEFPYAEMTGFAFEIYTLLPIGIQRGTTGFTS